MTNYAVENPYPVILGTNGSGLNAGSVYIGVAGQDPETNPVAVYWDAAGTNPANQPLTTIGGYIWNAGSPAQVYGPESYSMRVRDRFGAEVFYDANVNGQLADLIASLASPDGAGIVGFSHDGSYSAGTVGRKLKGQMISVTDAPYNAVGDGVADDTSSFSAAAQGAPAADSTPSAWGALPRADMAYVYVPAGTWNIASLVDTGNRDIFWVLDDAAIIANMGNLNGTIVRPNQRITRQDPYGTMQYASGGSFTTGSDYPDKPPAVTGVTTIGALANYPDRDVVAMFAGAYPRAALVDVGTATYTATTATIAAPSADTLKKYRKGMIIDTKHGTRATGVLESWSSDGSVLTVSAWYTNASTTVTPADGTGLTLNAMTKLWAMNGVVQTTVGGAAEQGIGCEITTRNERGAPSATLGNKTNRVWGQYVFNAGAYKAQASFMAVNNALYGYVAQDQDTGFYSFSQGSGDGFLYRGSGAALLVRNGSDQQTASLSSSGNLELGNTVASGTPFLDFHSSGNPIDYDARIVASGGSGSVGQGTLTFTSLTARFTAANMGFFGATATAKPTVTGSRGGNAALQSLLTALAALGLITDSSS